MIRTKGARAVGVLYRYYITQAFLKTANPHDVTLPVYVGVAFWVKPEIKIVSLLSSCFAKLGKKSKPYPV